MSASGIRLGLLVDSPLKRQYLSQSAREAGHQLVVNHLLSDCEDAVRGRADGSTGGLESDRKRNLESNEVASVEVDAWIVDVTLPADDEPPEAVQTLLENATVPLIISDSSDYEAGSEAHAAWLKRTLSKLRQLTGDINLQTVPRARRLWVLAASTGGPAAVKAFLSQLPPALDVAFIYVQHIDTGYTGTLVKMMSQSPYPAMLARDGDVIQANRLLIVTASERVDILENGTLAINGDRWAGPYAPSIDQLVANAARVYGENLGLMVFTGMGDDGAAASRLVSQRGGQVWVQTPQDCISSSMPESVLAAGTAAFSGTPIELAIELAQRLANTRRAPALNKIEEARPYESPTAQ